MHNMVLTYGRDSTVSVQRLSVIQPPDREKCPLERGSHFRESDQKIFASGVSNLLATSFFDFTDKLIQQRRLILSRVARKEPSGVA